MKLYVICGLREGRTNFWYPAFTRILTKLTGGGYKTKWDIVNVVGKRLAVGMLDVSDGQAALLDAASDCVIFSRDTLSRRHNQEIPTDKTKISSRSSALGITVTDTMSRQQILQAGLSRIEGRLFSELQSDWVTKYGRNF